MPRRGHGILARAIRLLVVLMAVQASGAPHVFADFCFDNDHSEPCSDDGDDDKSCPPGCPTCHACTHVQAPYAPAAVAFVGLLEAVPRAADSVLVTHVPQPSPSSVYRPPRV